MAVGVWWVAVGCVRFECVGEALWCYDNDPSHDLTDLMDNQKPWCGYQDPAIADANGCYSQCRSGSSRACIKTTRESSVLVNKQKTNDINKGCALDLHQYKKHIGADRCSSDPKEICGIVSGPINKTIDVKTSNINTNTYWLLGPPR